MCSGGYSAPSVQKVDPAPTNVNQGSPIDTESTQHSQRRKRGRSTNNLSSDRQTILGALAGDTGSSTRSTLG